jgi:GTP-binding protein Era
VLEKNVYRYLPEAEKLYGDDDISDQSLRFLMSEIVREKLLSHVRQELPFVTAVHIEQMEDRGPGKKYIKARIFVEKDTHRKIIIGRHGSLVKMIGTEARKEMEDILESKVFLDLHVRVKENWRDMPGVLDLIEGQ